MPEEVGRHLDGQVLRDQADRDGLAFGQRNHDAVKHAA